MIRSDYSFINKDELEDMMTKGTGRFEKVVKLWRRFTKYMTQTDQHKVAVEVNILKTNWIFRDRNKGERKTFSFFIKALVEAESETMYTTDFMITIVDEFWKLF